MFTSATARGQLRVSVVSADSLGCALNIKFMAANLAPSILKGADFMLKLDNDEIITLHADNSASACLGCGATGLIGSEAWGVSVYYPVKAEQSQKLMEHQVKKARIYLSSGFVDCDITEKGAKKLINALKLIQ